MPPRPLVIVGDESWTIERWEMEKRRLERRRKQWRESKMRRKLREDNPPIGYLHSLGCDGQHLRPRKDCKPIPCWTEPVE